MITTEKPKKLVTKIEINEAISARRRGSLLSHLLGLDNLPIYLFSLIFTWKMLIAVVRKNTRINNK